MVRRYDDYSFLNDNDLEKIAAVVNNQSKIVKITDDEKEAKLAQQQLRMQGYPAYIEQKNNTYQIITSPQTKILLKEALASKQFKKIAMNKYAFSTVANNTLGFQQYNFDDGTIWRVLKSKDGKEYLVKELNDEDNTIVRQPYNQIKSPVLASSNNKRIHKLCKILYDNPSDEFINDLVKYSTDSLSKLVTAKLNNIIDSELHALNITSPMYTQQVKERIASAIDNNTIVNRQQISDIITNKN